MKKCRGKAQKVAAVVLTFVMLFLFGREKVLANDVIIVTKVDKEPAYSENEETKSFANTRASALYADRKVVNSPDRIAEKKIKASNHSLVWLVAVLIVLAAVASAVMNEYYYRKYKRELEEREKGRIVL